MNTTKLIAAAILGDDAAKEKALRQITCQTAASHACFCQCGNIHDQKKIHVIEVVHPDKSENTLAACCPECFNAKLPIFRRIVSNAQAEALRASTEPSIVRVATWTKYFTIDAE
jgi:hypothetical protein